MGESHLLQNKVREILLFWWDPIGIRDIERAHDEYDSYIPPILRTILDGKGVFELRDQLLAIEVGQMGLKGDEGRALSVARKLVELQGFS